MNAWESLTSQFDTANSFRHAKNPLTWISLISVVYWLLPTQYLVDYSYYDLTLIRCSRGTPYTIHGLWPELNSRQWPAFCHPEKGFDRSAIEPLVPELEKYWFSCDDSDRNDDFWKHEWLKHGTCTGLSELEYFNRTLSLFAQAQTNGTIDEQCHYSAMTGNQCLIPYHLNWTLVGSEDQIDHENQFLQDEDCEPDFTPDYNA